MPSVIRPALIALGVAAFLTLGHLPLLGQSGNRNTPPGGSAMRTAPPSGSAQRQPQQAPLALEGYCPVSILQMHKWVKGNSNIRTVHDGRTYLFAKQQGLEMFQANPTKYVPALGGDCVVALVESGKRVPGNIRFATFHKDRLYMFVNEQAKKMFLEDPKKYAGADLAYGGNCVVCRVDMQETVSGKPEIAVVYEGLRYLFASEEQRREFLANPERYAVSAAAQPPSSNGSAMRGAGNGATAHGPATGSGTR